LVAAVIFKINYIMEGSMEYLEEIEWQEVFAGTVLEYDAKMQEAGVKLSHELCVGYMIRIKAESEWDQILERMFKDGEPVTKAFPDEIVRIVILHPAEKDDKIFLLIRPGSPIKPSEPPDKLPREEPPFDMPNLPDSGKYPVGPKGKGSYYKSKGHGSGG
jgi:hypothetical protein